MDEPFLAGSTRSGWAAAGVTVCVSARRATPVRRRVRYSRAHFPDAARWVVVMNRLDFRYLDVSPERICVAGTGAPARTGHPRSRRPARFAPRTTGTGAPLDSSRRLPWPDRPGGPGRRHPRRRHQRTAIHPFPGKPPAAKAGRPYPARPAGAHRIESCPDPRAGAASGRLHGGGRRCHHVVHGPVVSHQARLSFSVRTNGGLPGGRTLAGPLGGRFRGLLAGSGLHRRHRPPRFLVAAHRQGSWARSAEPITETVI